MLGKSWFFVGFFLTLTSYDYSSLAGQIKAYFVDWLCEFNATLRTHI